MFSAHSFLILGSILLACVLSSSGHDASQAPLVDAGKTAFGVKHSHDNLTPSSNRVEKPEDDSVVQIILEEISPFKVNPGPEKTPTKDNEPVPAVELDKLKMAAMNAGLSEAKANRVRRAAEALDLCYNDIAELRRVYNDPATSADHGDWVRRALERRYIEEFHQRSMRAAAPVIPGATGAAAAMTPEEYQRLYAAAQLSGIKNEELEKLGSALQASRLNKEQLKKLEEAIVNHSPTPENLKKLMDLLAKTRKARDATEDADEKEYDWNNPKSGSDWLFKPVAPKDSKAKAPPSATTYE